MDDIIERDDLVMLKMSQSKIRASDTDECEQDMERLKMMEDLECVVNDMWPEHRDQMLSTVARYWALVEMVEKDGTSFDNAAIRGMIEGLRDQRGEATQWMTALMKGDISKWQGVGGIESLQLTSP